MGASQVSEVVSIREGMRGVNGVNTGLKRFYFSLDDVRKTVLLSRESCEVQDGKTVERADCVCKTSNELFIKIW